METFDGNIQINRYDAEGLRHEMEENGKLVQFIFRGTEVVAEETREEKIRYIRTHELLASDAESARTYYHYASDELGSITHVTAGTDVINRYGYDAWGNAEVCEEQAANRFRYNGQQYDPVSRQYYLRARFYNPVIARFTQEDTYRGDGLNLYAYCKNNPVYYVDPSGHMCEPGVDRINDAINNRTATRDDCKKLANHLREKLRDGKPLTPAERDAANKLGISIEGKDGSVPNKGYKSFKELKADLGSAGEGNAWHHIVEQSQIAKSGFDPEQVNNINNIISIPHGKGTVHSKISAYYSSRQWFTGGKTVRQWLAGQGFERQFEFGMDLLKQYGNVTPSSKGWIFTLFDERREG